MNRLMDSPILLAFGKVALTVQMMRLSVASQSALILICHSCRVGNLITLWEQHSILTGL